MTEETRIMGKDSAMQSAELAGELVYTAPTEVTVASSDKHGNAILQAVEAVSGGQKGVYLTVNWPHHKLKAFFRAKNIDSSHIKFVDAITAMAMPHIRNHETCAFIQHPADLTYMDVQILEALKNIEGKKFLIVDSVSTLMAYNEKEKVMRFMHALSASLKSGGDATLITLESGDNAAARQVCEQFADQIIHV